MFLCISISVLAVLIILDFIPVKMAVDISKVENLRKYNINKNEKLYICEHVQVTGAIWRAIGDKDGVRDLKNRGSIYLAEPLQGKDPLKELNNAFTKPYLPQARNGFIFIGEEGSKLDEGDDTTVEFKVRDWKIISPIRRDSIRDIYAPKSYLTIYDFIKLP